MLKFKTLDCSELLWWYHCKYSDLNFTHMGILIWVHMTHHAQRCKCMQYGTASYLRTIVVHISEPFDIYSDSTCTLPIHSSLRGLLLIIQMSAQIQASPFAKHFLLPKKCYLCPPSAVECTPSSSPTPSFSEVTSKSCLEQEMKQCLERTVIHC